LVSCNPSHGSGTVFGGTGQLDTANAGPKTYTVTASSESGFTHQVSIGYTVLQPPTATIASPSSGGTYTLGQSVATSFSCAKGSDGPALSSCNDSNGTASLNGGKGTLDTRSPGSHSYTVTAATTDGYTRSNTINYNVQPAGAADPQPGGSADPQPGGSADPQPAGSAEPRPAGSAEPLSVTVPSAAAPLSVTLSQSSRKTLKDVRKNGLSVAARCTQICALKLSLTLTPKLAFKHKLISKTAYQKLKAKRGATVAVGTASTTLADDTAKSVRIMLSQKAKRALKKVKRITFGLRAIANAGSASANATLRIATS